MPYRMHVVKTEDFVRHDAYGKFDLPRSRQMLAAIATTCLEQKVDCALLDIRNMVPNADATLADIYHLAAVFHETGFKHDQKLAILHRYRSGERAEFFAMCASERGWNVRAFEEYEDAMSWFSNQDTLDIGK